MPWATREYAILSKLANGSRIMTQLMSLAYDTHKHSLMSCCGGHVSLYTRNFLHDTCTNHYLSYMYIEMRHVIELHRERQNLSGKFSVRWWDTEQHNNTGNTALLV